jgi:predicted DsbA family dithiol-disulfide isomerase
MRLAPRLRDAARLKDSDPELFDLRLAEIRVGMDVIDAIRALRHAQEQGQGVDQAAAKVREQLVRQQDIRDRMTTHEIRAMSARLDEMKADAEKRKAGSDARIDEMVRRLLERREPGDRREPGGRGRPPRPE